MGVGRGGLGCEYQPKLNQANYTGAVTVTVEATHAKSGILIGRGIGPWKGRACGAVV